MIEESISYRWFVGSGKGADCASGEPIFATEFRRICGVQAGLVEAIFGPVSRSNKVPLQRCALVLSPRFGRELIALYAEQAYAPTIPSAYHLQRAGSTFTNSAVSCVGVIKS
jgi:hypothetical protein